MTKTIQQLKEDLRFAEEGLEQMQQPDAGYFEDFDNKQTHEMLKYNQDISHQCGAIEKLNSQIIRLEEKQDVTA